MRARYAIRPLGLLILPMLLALSGCALPSVGATTTPPPAATTTVPGTPPGWSIYHGAHFTIAYPPQWSASNPTTGAGQGVVLVLTGPQPRDQIEVIEDDGVTSDQVANYCAPTGGTPRPLAGLAMSYSTAEGVHRVWVFVDNANSGYFLSTLDLDQSSAMQAQHDAILATFRPDDRTSGCA
jgi:hypothetical protein